jgi:hypothetical protein
VFKVRGYEWLWQEPRLLVPLFLVTIAVPLIALTPNRDASRRFAIGSVAGLGLLTALPTRGNSLPAERLSNTGTTSATGRLGSHWQQRLLPPWRCLWRAIVPVLQPPRAATLGTLVVFAILFRHDAIGRSGRHGGEVAVGAMVAAALAFGALGWSDDDGSALSSRPLQSVSPRLRRAMRRTAAAASSCPRLLCRATATCTTRESSSFRSSGKAGWTCQVAPSTGGTTAPPDRSSLDCTRSTSTASRTSGSSCRRSMRTSARV